MTDVNRTFREALATRDYRRVHIEGDNRAPVGMMARPSLFIRVRERMGL